MLLKLRLLPAITALCAIIVFNSCKEDTIISASVTPSIDNIHTFGISYDSVYVSTAYDDSVVTSYNLTPGYAALGWLNTDPYSGNTAGSLYMQVTPTTSGLVLSNDPDSGYIILPYGGYSFGDTSGASTQTYRAYAINDLLSKDSTYYAFNSKNVSPTVIGSGTLHFNGIPGRQIDSVTVRSGSTTRVVGPHLRLELTPTFLHSLRLFLNGSADSTLSAFVSNFPGIYIVPDSSGQGKILPYVRLDAASTDIYDQAGIVLYNHADTTTYSLPLNPSYGGHFNRITRNYVSPLINTALAAGLELLQNAPGKVIDVRITDIGKLPKNVVINKCELVFTRVPQSIDDNYAYPLRIYPVGIDTFGAKYALLDRYPLTTTDGLNFIDGTPRTTAIGDTIRYTVNFPRELQQAIIQGKSSLHLHIGGTATYPGAYRLLVGGRSSLVAPQYRTALNIVYSKQ